MQMSKENNGWNDKYKDELTLWTKTTADSLGLFVIADQVTYMV